MGIVNRALRRILDSRGWKFTGGGAILRGHILKFSLKDIVMEKETIGGFTMAGGNKS
jgi:hypothetical protein